MGIFCLQSLKELFQGYAEVLQRILLHLIFTKPKVEVVGLKYGLSY